MEIIKLEFQGIGPFTDRHVIDFREIGQSGLFLLEGPTGSGKTTILDAIVFALYGDVAGVDSSKARLVSTLLDPSREPFVDLVIDSSRGLLRVRRTPAFERPKRRGEGTTTCGATVKLWKLASADDLEGAPVSTNAAEVGEELQRAIGLTKSQFTQTVMLPQGHFATFLRAKPEDRRDVLQDIFGTEFYERFAKKLTDLAQEHRRREELARQSVYEVASGYCQVAWADDAAAATEPIAEQVAFDQARDAMDLDALLDGVRERSAALDAQLVDARASAEAARAARAEAVEHLRRIETRNELIAEVSVLRRRRAELQEREADVCGEEGRLGVAEQAEYLRRPLDRAERAAATCQDACRAKDAAFDDVRAGADADLVAGDPTVADLQAHAESARLAAGLLDRLVTLEKGMVSRAAAVVRQRQDLDDERSRIREGLERVVASRDEVVALSEQRLAREEVAATLTAAVEGRAEATHRRDAARKVNDLTVQLVEARATEQRLDGEHQDAVERHTTARQAWLDSIAGELAAGLIEGEPCAVCGSEVHPAPAVKPDGFVGRDAVQALAKAQESAARLAQEARAQSNGIADQIAEQTELTRGLTLAEAEAGVATAESHRREADLAGRDVAALRRRIESITTSADTTERDLREAAAVLATRQGAFEAAERQYASDEAEISAQKSDFVSVGARQEAFRGRADTAKRLAELLSAVGAAASEQDRCAAEVGIVLNERGFVTAEHARAAMLTEADRERLRALVATHRQEVATVAGQLASERYAGLDQATPEDSAPARFAVQEADESHQQAQRRSGMIEQTVNAARQASKDLSGHIKALIAVREQAGPVLRLANLVTAGEGNLQQVTLPTYVLLRRFEEVVDLANQRLDAMTGGRYELRRTDEREGRSRRQGLGLEVIDHQARDTARDPKTLSGGETFMASLALALGLADAVTSEAGGIELHTLFVDEGFGSLDPDTLDAVMDQLSALRDGGRTVGLVSHVAEMKQRIAERITVVPRRDGTSTLLCSTDCQPAAG